MLYKILTTGLMTIALLQPSSGVAGVYKWVDDNGQVHYGAHPQGQNAESIKIRKNETTKPRSIGGEDGKASAEQEESPESVEKPAEAKKPEISRKEKNRRCKQAKDKITSITSRGRMREINDKGEYVYLPDKERQKRLSDARKEVRKNCR